MKNDKLLLGALGAILCLVPGGYRSQGEFNSLKNDTESKYDRAATKQQVECKRNAF